MKRLSIAFVIAVAPALVAQTINLKPGQYEIVSTVSMAGRSSTMPPRKDLRCYTAQDVEELPKHLGGGQRRQGCKVVSSRFSGSTMTFTTECTAAEGGPQSTITGEVNFTSRESWHSVVTMKDNSGRSTNPMFQGSTITIDGKRVGDCSK